MINAKNIYYAYEDLQVLKGINLNIKKGEFVSIVGSSGAGKTTLLQLLGTLDKIQNGSLVINGRETKDLSEKEVSNFRNKEIGFVFQFHNLLTEFSALENVCLPAYLNGTARETAEKKGLELLKLLDLTNRTEHKPDELSGGEQQRVAVARALVHEPEFVLADEPTGNLDSKNTAAVLDLLIGLNIDGTTVILITHDQDVARESARRITFKDGRIDDSLENQSA